jgi:hypothetical protein
MNWVAPGRIGREHRRMGYRDWATDAFHDEVRAWAAQSLDAELTGEFEQPHVRPWSSAIRLGTTGGPVWFKVNAPATAYEAALIERLNEWTPRLAPRLLAQDLRRGWSIVEDAGPVMRSLAEPDELWSLWAEVLEGYADAQILLAPRAQEFLAAGVPDLNPAITTDLATDLVVRLSAIPIEEGGLTDDEADALRRALRSVERGCERLEALGIGVSINHDDLHTSNICWGDDGFRIIDWGDTVIGHPFGTMLATVNSVAWHAKCERDDPRIESLVATYLAQFSDFGTVEELRPLVADARTVGCVSKALSYERSFTAADLEAEADEEFPVRGWLLELLEDEFRLV